MAPADTQWKELHINYIILAHKNPAQVARLIQALSTDTSRFYIHVDKNTDIHPFERLLEPIKSVSFVHSREKGTWGDLGIVKATIHALQQIVADQRTGYCVLLSGQDYPIKSTDKIAQYLTRNQGINFMNTTPLPSSKWNRGGMDRIEYYKFNLSEKRGDYVILPPLLTADFLQNRSYYTSTIKQLLRRKTNPWAILKKRHFPGYLRPFCGDQWWTIPVETAHKLLRFLEDHPDYFRYHQHTLLPDEIAIQSVIRHLFGAEDKMAIRPTVTYINWERQGVTLPVTFDHNDIQELLNQPEEMLFARKFDMETDAKILDLLDGYINSGT
ncbi:beta-1,6-N-acetylglucosaminyltransferase [Hymenobacter setariae]|uniref:Peptide O-xylosyltransferase n=1 Tax=Hymenobacter setariae TaxID=2594794 RepID=A0A558BR39_9BACT|nr:beta-1,6-N-acetylglucosaminyltransferase [Hymenobacter setariae]TVT38987.1 beta-1,6-N-acetylglucosaminyltransferase [Hymenobacter setariae]